MLFKEIIGAYSDNYKEPITTIAVLLIVEAGGVCSYHWALKG
jgi:hypothetical protein